MRKLRDWSLWWHHCLILLNKNWIAVRWSRRWIWWIRCGRSWRHFDVLLWRCLCWGFFGWDAEKKEYNFLLNWKDLILCAMLCESSTARLIEQKQPQTALLTLYLSYRCYIIKVLTTHRTRLWPCVIVNHSIASHHMVWWFDIELRARQQLLTNAANILLLILGIFVRWPRHVTVTQCRWQCWRCGGCIHADCLVLVLFDIGKVEIFVVITFWSVERWIEMRMRFFSFFFHCSKARRVASSNNPIFI